MQYILTNENLKTIIDKLPTDFVGYFSSKYDFILVYEKWAYQIFRLVKHILTRGTAYS